MILWKQRRKMKDLLKDEAYCFVNTKDKEFMVAFDIEMNRFGYRFGRK